MELHNLVKTEKKRKRVGRGGAHGGTSGRGGKGQKARTSGTVRPGFEGGQMPLYRRSPKRGFTNVPFKQDVLTVSVDALNEFFEDGAVVTPELLIEHRLVKSNKSKKEFSIKVLAGGTIDKKLTVRVHAVSASAKQAIESAGGAVEII